MSDAPREEYNLWLMNSNESRAIVMLCTRQRGYSIAVMSTMIAAKLGSDTSELFWPLAPPAHPSRPPAELGLASLSGIIQRRLGTVEKRVYALPHLYRISHIVDRARIPSRALCSKPKDGLWPGCKRRRAGDVPSRRPPQGPPRPSRSPRAPGEAAPLRRRP